MLNSFEQELKDAGRGHLIGGWTHSVGTSYGDSFNDGDDYEESDDE